MRWCLGAVLVFLSVVGISFVCHADGQPPKSEEAVWAKVLAKLQNGEVADLNEICGDAVGPPADELDPRNPPKQGIYRDQRWTADCRTISSARLRAVITGDGVMNTMPHGITLRAAHIKGKLDLRDAHVRAAEVVILQSLIDGDLDLTDAHVDGRLELSGSTIGGDLYGDSASFDGMVVMLENATVRGQVHFISTEFHSNVLMRYAHFGDDVDFSDSRIGGDMLIDQSEFFGDLSLGGASVHEQLSMIGARFVTPQDKAGQAHSFSGERLVVGADCFFRQTHFPSFVSLVHARITGALDLRGTSMTVTNLQGAYAGNDLLLASEGMRVNWVQDAGVAPSLDLRNVQVGNLQDDADTWPPGKHIAMEGFTYAHLGGFGATPDQDPLLREMKWWRRWFRHDPQFSNQPYTQLASILAARGDRDQASMILFFGRDRERDEAGINCRWLQALRLVPVETAAAADNTPDADPAQLAHPCRPGEWLKLSLLQATIGYGIGNYTFRAVGWIAFLALVGTAILACAPGVRGTHYASHRIRGPQQKSLIWCLGASLSHILPVVSLSPEFTDFFNDPQRRRMHPWQHVVFAILVVLGWVLGVVLLAAFSGITQK